MFQDFVVSGKTALFGEMTEWAAQDCDSAFTFQRVDNELGFNFAAIFVFRADPDLADIFGNIGTAGDDGNACLDD